MGKYANVSIKNYKALNEYYKTMNKTINNYRKLLVTRKIFTLSEIYVEAFELVYTSIRKCLLPFDSNSSLLELVAWN